MIFFNVNSGRGKNNMVFVILINPNQFFLDFTFTGIAKNMNLQNGNRKEKL